MELEQELTRFGTWLAHDDSSRKAILDACSRVMNSTRQTQATGELPCKLPGLMTEDDWKQLKPADTFSPKYDGLRCKLVDHASGRFIILRGGRVMRLHCTCLHG